MKTIALLLTTALAGFATTARADHGRIDVGVGVTFGTPRVAPIYVPAPHYRPARGHWENVTVKSWVPARWIVTRDRWGRPHRVLQNGYYTYRTERVWVEGGRPLYGYSGRHDWNG
jgi:hypothetical protein